MINTLVLVVALLVVAAAFKPMSPIATKAMSLKMAGDSFVPIDLSKRGKPLEEYVLEMQSGAKAICRTYGGNVFTYKTRDGIEVLGKRADALDPRADTKPYAGGAPHCFPIFGPSTDGKLAQHGFARGLPFIQEERAKKLSFDRMIFKLVDTPETFAVWPYKFEYRYDITLRDDSLEWEIIVINEDDKPYEITTGLHNYFDISSLKNIVISGPFSGAKTINRLTGAEGVAASNDITITEATDMVYKGVKGPITITDTVKGTKTTITRKGYEDTVIWSPYGNEEMGYDKFICVEPVTITPVPIPVGKFKETHFSQMVKCVKI